MQALVAAPAAAALRPLQLRPSRCAAPVLGSSRRAAKPQAAQQPRSSALRSLSAARSPLVAGGAVLPQRPSRRRVTVASAPRAGAGKPARNDYNGVFLLILINVVLYVADHVMHVPVVSQMLYLHHAAPKWWQFVTCAFCHGSFDHLSGNLFFLLTFGKAVESEERAAGVWLAYLACGVGSAVASWLLLPAVSHGMPVVSLGASGAVFGLFVISVFTKLNSFDWRKLLEACILGTFVWERIWSEISITTQGGGIGASNVNHVAHLAGALCGVLLIALLNRALPPLGDDGDDDGAGGGAARRLKE